MRDKILTKMRLYDEQVESFLRTLSSFSDEALNKIPADNGWTALQTLHHLILSEELGLKYVEKKLKYESNPEAAGIVHRLRGIGLRIYLRLPFAFPAPPIVSGESLPHPSTLAETAERWKRVRQAWMYFFENMPEQLQNKAVYKHPVVGRIAWPDIINFYQTHFERHRKQALRAAGSEHN